MSLRDLFVKLKVSVDGMNKLETLNALVDKSAKGFQRLGSHMDRFTGALTVAAVALFIEHITHEADALMHQAEALGITTDELQKYQYVSKQMQVPVQQVAVALRFFNRAIGEASFGSKAAVTAFGRLGMSVVDAHGKVRPTDELLFEFADRLQKVPSQAQRTAIAMRTLGRGGAAMLPVLQQGSKALREMFADVEELGGGFDKDFIEKAHALVRQQARLSMGWKTMAGLLGKEVLPWMTRLAENGVRNVKVWIDFGKHTYGIRTALMAMGAALAVAAGAWAVMNIAMLPAVITIGLLVAGFTALYLVFDDLYTFVQGGDSVIGRLLDQLTGGHAKEVLDQIVKAFTDIKDALGFGGASARELGLSLLTMFARSIPSMIAWGGQFASMVLDGIAKAIQLTKQLGLSIRSVLSGNVFSFSAEQQKEHDQIDAAYEAAHARFQRMARALDSLTTPTSRAPGPTDADWNPNGPSGDELNPGRTTTGSPITITQHFHGPADPKQVQDASKKGVVAAVKDSATQNRDSYSAATTGMPTYSTVGEAR